MARTRSRLAVITAGIIASALPAGAAELKQVGTMTIPGEAFANFDIATVDPATGRLYVADRSNKGIDVFDTGASSYVGRAGAFAGVVMKNGKVANAVSGPDGVVVAGDQIWAGDGDSTVKVIDARTMQTVATLATTGKTRLDEMAFDPKDHVFIGINNAEEPPFATLISTDADHKVIGKLVFDGATDGAEQPAYNPRDGLFYVSIPQVGTDPKTGAVAVVDPSTAKLVKMLPVEGCHPAGLAFGPDGDFILGCGADGTAMPAVTVIMNAATGAEVARVAGIGGADMVNYNAHNGQYYTASRANQGGPVLGVIDSTSHALLQKVAIKGGYPHAVASSETSGQVFVPVSTVGGGDGSIHVYAPAP